MPMFSRSSRHFVSTLLSAVLAAAGLAAATVPAQAASTTACTASKTQALVGDSVTFTATITTDATTKVQASILASGGVQVDGPEALGTSTATWTTNATSGLTGVTCTFLENGASAASANAPITVVDMPSLSCDVSPTQDVYEGDTVSITASATGPGWDNHVTVTNVNTGIGGPQASNSTSSPQIVTVGKNTYECQLVSTGPGFPDQTITKTVTVNAQATPQPGAAGVQYGAIIVGNIPSQNISLSAGTVPTGWSLYWYNTTLGPIPAPAVLSCNLPLSFTPVLVRDGTNRESARGTAITVNAPCSLPTPTIDSVTLSGGTATVNYSFSSPAPPGTQVDATVIIDGKQQTKTSCSVPASGTGGSCQVATGVVPPLGVTVTLIASGGPALLTGPSNTRRSNRESPSVTFPAVTGREGQPISAATPGPSSSTQAISDVGGSYSLRGGPAGLSINSRTGAISGTPKVGATGTMTVEIAGSGFPTAQIPVSYDISAAAPSQLGTFTYPKIKGQVGVALSPSNPAANSVKGFYFAPDLCQKVPGLDINPRNGAITGTPRVQVSQTSIDVYVRNTDPGASGCVTLAGKGVAKGAVDVAIAAGTALTYPSSKVTLPLGQAFTLAPSSPNPSTATGVSYAVTGGSLPAGLALESTSGVISGTPTAATLGAHVTVTATVGAFRPQADIDFTVFDASNAVEPTYPSVTSSIGVAKSILPALIPGWTAFSLGSGTPAGMTINASTGEISWTATAPQGARSIIVNANNPGGVTTALPPFTWDVTAAPASKRTPGLTPVGGSGAGAYTGGTGGSSGSTGAGGLTPCIATAGQLYTDIHASVGSTLTIAPNLTGMPTATVFTVTGGALPKGVTLDREAGVISGTPESPNNGYGPLEITATAPDGTRRVADINVAIDDPHHAVNYPNRIIASIGSPVTVTPITINEHGKTTYELVCGTLPSGLSLDPKTGVISGTPTTLDERPIPLRIRITDDYGWIDSSQIIVVNPGTTPWLRYPEYAELGAGATATIVPTATGLGPVAGFTADGDLPPGLTLDQRTGVISGTPRVRDGIVYEPTITALDAAGTPVASTWVSITVIKPAVPMRVVAQRATTKLKASKAVVVISSVKHPSWVTLKETVKCSGCTWTLNKKTGKLTVKPGKKTKRISVTILGSPKGAKYSETYAGHAWSRSWKVKR